MTQSVNGMNRSMRTLVNDALARRQAAEDLKQSYYMQAVEEQRARREAELARREAEIATATSTASTRRTTSSTATYFSFR